MLLHLIYEHWRRPVDVLYCHEASPPAYVGATFRRPFKVPMVVRPHGADILPGEYIQANPRLKRRVCRGLAAADLVITQSEFLKREIKALGLADDKIRLIPNGVRLATFQQEMPPPALPYSYILAMGSLSHKKGFDVLLRAFADVVTQEPWLHLVLAGSGKDRLAYEHLIGQLAIRERVHLVGVVHGRRKVQLYQHCLFFVCPSRREPFASVNVEALASGKPIVATAMGGNLEVVDDGANGFLVPPNDPSALARGILQLVQDCDMRFLMAKQAATRAVRFDWSMILPQYKAVFREAQARQPAG